MRSSRLVVLLLLSGLTLALGLGACTQEVEEEAAEPTTIAAPAGTRAATTTTPGLPMLSPLSSPQPPPGMAFGGALGEAVAGIGVYLGQNPVTGEIVIVSPLLDSPAYRAGVQAGDIILAVDGRVPSEWTDATPPITGPEGTEVTLRVRHTDGGEEEIVITRAMIVFPQPVQVESIGIGLLAGTVPGAIVVQYPGYSSRAERAGIEHDDLILAVGGQSATGWTASDAADRIAAFGDDEFTMTVRHIDGVTEEVTLGPASEFCRLLIPGTFMGAVYLNGEAAPAGSVITAEQGGVIWGSTTIEDAGHYVLDTLAIDVPRQSPPCSPDGPLSFRMGDLTAKESADWRSGPINLDLTFGSPPTVTPTAGATP